MIEGAEITLGGKVFVAAPLNFKALERYAGLITRMGGGDFTPGDFGEVRGLIEASLRRNHPDIESDFIADHLDQKNWRDVMIAVMGGSGAKQADPASGEA